MPEIPDFQAQLVAIPEPQRSYVSPEELAEPGRALERAGGQLGELGAAVGRISDFQARQYVENQSADATIGGHDKYQSALDQAQKTGDYQNFATNVRQSLGADLQQRLDNAPSSQARAELQGRFATLTDEISTRASLAEHGMAVLDHGAQRANAVQGFQTQVYRDPTTVDARYADIMARIANDAQAGLLNPEQRQNEEKSAGATLYGAAIEGRAKYDPVGTARDLENGRYDQHLTPAQIERLQPLVDEGKATGAANRYLPAGGGGGVVGPQPTASDAEADAALAPIIERESKGNPNIGFGGTDLSNAPRDATGFPIWNGAMGPQGISHAAGTYQIEPGTWRPIAQKLGITDFSPASQTAVARELYREQGTGPWAASASTSGASPAAAAAPPDAGKAIAGVESEIAGGKLTQRQGDLAIGMITRRVHESEQATAGERFQLEENVKDGVAALQDGRDWNPPTGDIRRLLPPDRAAAILSTIDAARDFGQVKNAVEFASPQQLDQIRTRQQAKLADPNATDFVRNQRYADLIDRAIAQRNKALAADPAAYVESAAPVKAAAGAIDPENPAPGTQAVIAARLAEQQRLGVAGGDARALPNDQAEQAAREIAAGDPGQVDMAQRLASAQKLYGEKYWPIVFGDLVRAKLPPEYQVLANMDAPGQVVAAGDMQRMLSEASAKGGVEKLREAAGGDAVKEINQGLDAQMADFRATMSSDGTYAIFRDAVQQLAWYYAFRGQDAASALTNAYNGVIGSRYDFDGALRVPKGTLGAVQSAAAEMQRQVAPDQLGPIPGNPNLTPEERKGIYLDAMRRGFWATDKADDGAILMLRYQNGGGAPAMRADGTPVTLKFADLKEAPGP